MSKAETAEGRQAWVLIVRTVKPFLREGETSKGHVIEMAAVVLEADKEIDGETLTYSAIKEAAAKRCRAPTLNLIQKRIARLPVAEDVQRNTFLANLKSAMGTLWARHNDPNHPEIIALQWAVNQLEGRE